MSEAKEALSAVAEIIEPRLARLVALCRHLNVRSLDLFGSGTTSRFDPKRSDLDFFVEFEPMPPGQYAKACRELREGLGRLFERPIDLLTEAALVNPYLRRQVEAEKRTLYPPP
jgi:uncharacterized protein